MAEEKFCEACSNDLAVFVVEQESVCIPAGSLLCNTCYYHRGASEVGDRIRARRAAKESAVVDADGVPIRVGDRVRHVTGGVGTIDVVEGSEWIGILYDSDSKNFAGKRHFPVFACYLTHLPAAGEAREDPGIIGMDPGIPGSERTYEVTREGGKITSVRDVSAPGPSLADFTTAVRLYLEPRLPAGVRCVTDTHGKAPGMFICRVMDASGAETYMFIGRSEACLPAATRGLSEALLSRSAREQPYTEPARKSFVDAYLAGGKA